MSEAAPEMLNKSATMGGMTEQQTSPNPSPVFVHVREGNEDSPSVLNLAPDPDGSALKNKVLGDEGDVDVQRFFPSVDKRVVKRSSSCPLGRTQNLQAGPWSLAWIDRHKRIEGGTTFSIPTKVNSKGRVAAPRVSNKKGGGYLRHCARRLKHIARLPDADRKEVLRALRKTTKKRKKVAGGSQGIVSFSDKSPQSGSQASVNNNDWSNWLVVHGNDKVKADDVRGIGKTVGLNFEGNKNNMFDVLSRVGRNYKEGDGRGV